MPWNGSGTFTPLGSPEFPAVAGEVIYADYFNAIVNDLIDGLNNCTTRDHQEGLDWSNYTDNTKGAALVGYGAGLSYPVATVGSAIDDLLEAADDLVGTANQVTVTQTDADTITLSLPSEIVTPGTLASVGVVDANDSAAGKVGEYLSATSSSPVSLAVSGTNYNLTSLALAAGDYLVGGVASFDPDASFAFNFISASSSLLSATPATFPYSTAAWGANTALGAAAGAADVGLALPTRRVNVSSPTTVYLVAKANFSAGTCTAQGNLWALRVR